jgi:hypothetical protein
VKKITNPGCLDFSDEPMIAGTRGIRHARFMKRKPTDCEEPKRLTREVKP